MQENKKAYRQVHLDFHTSPDIEGIGSKFSKENFQAALKRGNVDSITVFAKCHHSMCYYPTKVGTMHPHLDFDLTGAMVDAAHEIGVRAPIYITAGWSDEDAKAHPEWIAMKKDGSYQMTGTYDPAASYSTPKKGVAWHWLCLNDGNEYTKHIYELTEEVCKRYKKVDGLFYDICLVGESCYCASCVKGMREMGLNPENEADAKKYYVIKRQAFMQKCADIMRKYHPEATIFFNSGGANPKKKEFHAYQSHFEMEDLPTAWGGYDKLPLRAKCFIDSGKHLIGMTGKFHLSWGEFGGFKFGDALKYEVATMAMYGAGASVGDHMHPDGEMEMQTYDYIGEGYDYLEKIAPFCYGGASTANIGLCISEDWSACEGVSKILQENQLDYLLVRGTDFAKFDTVILPDKTKLDDAELAALQAYIANGGKVLMMGEALVQDGAFQIDTGLSYIGAPEFDCDYIVPTAEWNDVPNAPMLQYAPGQRTENKDAEIYAEIMTPYFSRTYQHFCGHKNTPYNKSAEKMPAIAKKGNVVYLAHSVSKSYDEYGSLFHKRYFMHALNLVYGGAPLQVEGMASQGRATMIAQEDKRRYCINLVYASPIRRGQAEIIEDILPIYNIGVTVKTDKQIKRVYVGLTGEALAFVQQGDTVKFVLPELNCHASVVVEY